MIIYLLQSSHYIDVLNFAFQQICQPEYTRILASILTIFERELNLKVMASNIRKIRPHKYIVTHIDI